MYVLRDEEQAYARIDRMGNLNRQVTTYRLVADARVEVKILQKQARRKAIFQAAIDTTLQEWSKRWKMRAVKRSLTAANGM